MELGQLSDDVEVVSRGYAHAHGFTRDATWFLLKLQEEVGELTQAFLMRTGQARTKGHTPQELDDRFGAELADLLCHLLGRPGRTGRAEVAGVAPGQVRIGWLISGCGQPGPVARPVFVAAGPGTVRAWWPRSLAFGVRRPQGRSGSCPTPVVRCGFRSSGRRPRIDHQVPSGGNARLEVRRAGPSRPVMSDVTASQVAPEG